MSKFKYLRFFNEISINDVAQVGGKNASLGEMFRILSPKGINLPNGFCTTAESYKYFLDQSGIYDQISNILANLDVNNVRELRKQGAVIRKIISESALPNDLETEIRSGYSELCNTLNKKNVVVAIRSSATAEDLPNASFAGQQETYLNVSGADNILKATKNCIASLFTDRAIVYRVDNGFDHMKVALSVGIQQMVAVRSKSAGIMFTLDTETGFRNAVVINSAYGLGENIVQGRISPDEFTVFKPTLAILKRKLGTKRLKMIPSGSNATKNILVSVANQKKYSLSDEQIKILAKWAIEIENHYGKPMDIEWALDEDNDTLYVVQARPETVQSQKDPNIIEEFVRTEEGKVLVTGTSVGKKIGTGKANIIMDLKNIEKFKEGSVLVTDMTDPDWVPIMKKAAAIVTNKGGRTCHAAIVSREFGIPCVVGTDHATKVIANGDPITVSCVEGDQGKVFAGILKFDIKTTNVKNLKRPHTKIMMNVGSPDFAFSYSMLPNDGVGLAREEFIIDSHVKIHPLALLQYDKLKDAKARKEIAELTKGYKDKNRYFVDKLAEGVSIIGAAFYPKDVIVRFSDFKTNEYANLIGGKQFEPKENNPMIGWRGASRYYSDDYRRAFELECQAIKKVRNEMGITNVKSMIPFCRDLNEAKKVLSIMESAGLRRGENGFEVYMMVEIPSNVILGEKFAELFDGFSVGSNDLTQLTLGVDRDNYLLSHIYDENNEAVLELVRNIISIGKKKKIKVGICGQAPSDKPDFAKFLIEEGIDSISLAPDTIVKTTIATNEIEAKMNR